LINRRHLKIGEGCLEGHLPLGSNSLRPCPPSVRTGRSSRTHGGLAFLRLVEPTGSRTGEGRRRTGGKARRTGAPLRFPALAGYLVLSAERHASALRRAAIAEAMAGRPHSRMYCAPWGTPQRIARGARLRRATPPAPLTYDLDLPLP